MDAARFRVFHGVGEEVFENFSQPHAIGREPRQATRDGDLQMEPFFPRERLQRKLEVVGDVAHGELLGMKPDFLRVETHEVENLVNQIEEIPGVTPDARERFLLLVGERPVCALFEKLLGADHDVQGRSQLMRHGIQEIAFELEGVLQFGGFSADFLEQPRVFDGNSGAAGELLQGLDLVLMKMARPVGQNAQHANHLSVTRKQGNAGIAAEPVARRLLRGARIRCHYVGDRDGSTALDDRSGQPATGPGRSRLERSRLRARYTERAPFAVDDQAHVGDVDLQHVADFFGEFLQQRIDVENGDVLAEILQDLLHLFAIARFLVAARILNRQRKDVRNRRQKFELLSAKALWDETAQIQHAEQLVLGDERKHHIRAYADAAISLVREGKTVDVQNIFTDHRLGVAHHPSGRSTDDRGKALWNRGGRQARFFGVDGELLFAVRKIDRSAIVGGELVDLPAKCQTDFLEVHKNAAIATRKKTTGGGGARGAAPVRLNSVRQGCGARLIPISRVKSAWLARDCF